MLLAILSGAILSATLLFVPIKHTGRVSSFSFLLPLSLFIYFGSKSISISTDNGIRESILSYSSIVDFSLQINFDGLAWLFVALITGIGTLIFWYAGAYMNGKKETLRLLAFLSLFMSAMLGVVLMDHLLALFVFWELTSISSFFLIGFKFREEASRLSALKALAVTGSGGLVMLAGFIMLGETAGSYYISDLVNTRLYESHPVEYLPIFILILIGAITKSAQFPFHFWLPGAMKAPTPVSAYLHSATMVKAGVYLLARLSPVLGGNDIWSWTLMTIGAFTMVYAAFQSLLKYDLKSILAFTTVSALGIMVFLIGVDTEQAVFAALLFILVHALYKATLFMVAGTIDHESGSRDIRQLAGLYRYMPILAFAGILGALSSGGVPPFVGFIGKDAFYEAALHAHGEWFVIFISLAVITGVMLFVSGFTAGVKPFFGKMNNNITLPGEHDHGKALVFAPLLLGVLGLILGIIPMIAEHFFIEQAFVSVFRQSFSLHVAIWHGFNLVLLLSFVTLVLGTLIYFILKNDTKRFKFLRGGNAIDTETALIDFSKLFNKGALFITSNLQNGYLSKYIRVIMIFVSGVLIYKLSIGQGFRLDVDSLTRLTIYEIITIFLLSVSIVLTVVSRSRLVAVAFMGVVGLSICLIFVFYSAPDLAMTQFTIDTLTVILFVLVLFKLPKFIPFKFGWRHVVDGIIAMTFGTIMALLALEALEYPPNREISKFYADNSYILAKGKNIVNVILVDFRGADTIVEIVVLTIAAIGVFSLLKLYIHDGQKEE